METPKRKASAAKMAATERWESKAYDRIMIRFPKGTRARIKSTGESVNGYVVRHILASLGDTETPGDTARDAQTDQE